MRYGKGSLTREFSHKNFHGTLCLHHIRVQILQGDLHSHKRMFKRGRWNETGENFYSHENYHTKIFTGHYISSLRECTSHKETSIHIRGHSKDENSKNWSETGEKFIHTRVFARKFSRDDMFTPYMKTSLIRRPVFT